MSGNSTVSSAGSQIRVLHLLNDVEDNGNGIVYSTMELVLEQAAMGLNVAVGSAGGSFEDLLSRNGIRHYKIPQRSVRKLMLNIFNMQSCLNEFRPHIVHSHMVSGVLLALAARSMRGAKAKPVLIAHVRNSWMKHARLMRWADHCIALSEVSRNFLLSVGFNPNRLSVVRNGSFGSRLRRRGDSRGAPDVRLPQPCVVSVCGLYRRKGVFDLVEAARECVSRMPNLKFVLVGEGDERANLETAIEGGGLRESFKLLGFQADVASILKQATVFVLASHDEPFGRVILEARDAGAAIVATNVGGIPEATDGGRCALLVPSHDPSALAAAICALVEDDSQRRSLIEKGRENLEYWSVNRVAREVGDVYQSQLRKCGRTL